MTDELKIKIGQMFSFGIPKEGMQGEFLELCEKYKIGSFWIGAHNIVTPEQFCRDVSEIRKITYGITGSYPILGIDQEGGWVTRLYDGAATISGTMSYAASGISADELREVGRKQGRMLRAIGINVNSAPDLDVNIDPDNPIICSRSYGDDPEKVAEYGVAMADGMESEGVMASVKHFPGHGNVSSDTHLAAAVNTCDKETLKNTEFIPFQRAFDNKVGALMTAHVIYDKISPLPATISPEIMTTLLRDEMGFEGIVITDSINMNAILVPYPDGEGAVRAILAGCDIVLSYPYHGVHQMRLIEAVYEAVESGRISRERIEESYERIVRMKEKYDIANAEPNYDLAKSLIYNEEDIQRNFEDKLRSITCLKDNGVLSTLGARKILCIAPICDAIRGVEEERRDILSFADRFAAAFESAEALVCPMSAEMTPELLEKINGECDTVVVGLFNTDVFTVQLELLKAAAKAGKTTVAVLLKSPYTFRSLGDCDAVIASYEYTTLSVNATIEAMKRNEYRGTLPVKLAK